MVWKKFLLCPNHETGFHPSVFLNVWLLYLISDLWAPMPHLLWQCLPVKVVAPHFNLEIAAALPAPWWWWDGWLELIQRWTWKKRVLESEWLRLSVFEHFKFPPEIRLQDGIVNLGVFIVCSTLLRDLVLEGILNYFNNHPLFSLGDYDKIVTFKKGFLCF